MITHEQTYTIQEAAQFTGLTVHTLRYYERIGLLAAVNRASNGHRRYTDEDLRRITFLNRLRMTGMPIRHMQQFAVASQQGDDTLEERIDMLEIHRASVLAQIDALQQNLDVIEMKIRLYREKKGHPLERSTCE